MRLKEGFDPITRRKLEDTIFVGRLVTEEDLRETPFQEPVYFHDEFSVDIRFMIRCLSPIPPAIADNFAYSNQILIGGTRSYNNVRKFNELINYERLAHHEKKEQIEQLLANKLIVFSLNPTPSYVYVEIHKVENVYPFSGGYGIIPSPQLGLHEKRDDFEKKLISSTRRFTLPKYPNLFAPPEFVHYDGKLYSVSLTSAGGHTQYVQEDRGEIVARDVADRFSEWVDARIDDHLYFIPNDKLEMIRDDMQKKGVSLHAHNECVQAESEAAAAYTGEAAPHAPAPASAPSRVSAASSSTAVASTASTTNTTGCDASSGSAATGTLAVRSTMSAQTSPSPGELPHVHASEWQFIERLKVQAARRGFYYAEEDLVSFHVSAKTNLITIVGGMSGTGKSHLVQLYAETMGLTKGKDFLMVPMSPSYQEPHDLLGYLNPTTGIYYESETELVSLLLAAESNPEKMYMCLFDEMNLSQVEHWFSPFISLLEVDEDERYLTLFSKNNHCLNQPYKATIKIGSNIIFVGTVNFDETSTRFSDRLLDRTNVIIPGKMSFAEALQRSIQRGKQFGDLEGEEREDKLVAGAWSDITTETYRCDWATGQDGLTFFSPEEIAILDRLHEYLHEADQQKGVSFRVARAMAKFMANIPLCDMGEPLLSRAVAFDLQVAQRIITKIQGTETVLAPLVGNAHDEGSLVTYLQSSEVQQVSPFHKSLALLERKRKELIANGFVR